MAKKSASPKKPSKPKIQPVAPIAASNGVLAGLADVKLNQKVDPTAQPWWDGLTAEQQDGLVTAQQIQADGGVLVLVAGAGCGKTHLLTKLEQVLLGRGRYMAFNAPLVAESKPKFSKAECSTYHSMCFRSVGCKFAHRLGGDRVKAEQVAAMLGLEGVNVELSPETKADPAKGLPAQMAVSKHLSGGFLAGCVMGAVRRFCQSADQEVQAAHFRYIDGIDVPTVDGKKTFRNNDKVKAALLPFACKCWQDYSKVDGRLPGYNHDCYVKTFELDGLKVPADYILFDESQDVSPCVISILQQQTHTLVVLVGDGNQEIYAWRGACNAMKEFPDAPRRLLSQSFRFGQAIADVANAVLATLDEPTDLILKGLPSIPSRVAFVDNPRCVLTRTNAAAISTLLKGNAEGRRGCMVGKIDDVVSWVRAAKDLQSGRRTNHPELCCFDSWAEVVAYSKLEDGEDLQLMCKLVKEFGCDQILQGLEGMPTEDEADFVVSTAHRSKGREWSTVKLGSDFKAADRMDDAERRLLYVAATRAQHTLDVSQCPPFCGGDRWPAKDEDDERGYDRRPSEQLPTIQVRYTVPQPTAEEQAEILAEQAQQKAAKPAASTAARPATPDVQPAPVQPINNVPGQFTWTKGRDGSWLVRGPKGHVGKAVTVVKKSGASSQEHLAKEVASFSDGNALYIVGSANGS